MTNLEKAQNIYTSMSCLVARVSEYWQENTPLIAQAEKDLAELKELGHLVAEGEKSLEYLNEQITLAQGW